MLKRPKVKIRKLTKVERYVWLLLMWSHQKEHARRRRARIASRQRLPVGKFSETFPPQTTAAPTATPLTHPTPGEQEGVSPRTIAAPHEE